MTASEIEAYYRPFARRGAWLNYGYWDDGVHDQDAASERLLAKLAERLPARGARVLDVAFGTGLSTQRLVEIYGAECVTGINVASDQLEIARARGLGCRLLQMDAARLDFSPGDFDAILCIEAAFHFATRCGFFSAARRALASGGRLVMSDVLFRSLHGMTDRAIWPVENVVASVDAYRDQLAAAGFSSVEIEISTERQWLPHARHIAEAAGWRLEPFTGWYLASRFVNLLACVVVVAIA